MSANNSGDDSECTNSSAQSYEVSGDNNYSENDDVNTESETKSAHSSYSNCSLTYCNDVVINQIDNVIVNEKHLIDHNTDDNSIRKPRSIPNTCCKLKSFGIIAFGFFLVVLLHSTLFRNTRNIIGYCSAWFSAKNSHQFTIF